MSTIEVQAGANPLSHFVKAFSRLRPAMQLQEPHAGARHLNVRKLASSEWFQVLYRTGAEGGRFEVAVAFDHASDAGFNRRNLMRYREVLNGVHEGLTTRGNIVQYLYVPVTVKAAGGLEAAADEAAAIMSAFIDRWNDGGT